MGQREKQGHQVSNSDSFIDEVTEEVRRDRMYLLMRRYGWIALVAVILLVGGAAWNEYRKAQASAAAEAAGDALLDALQADTVGDRLTALESVLRREPPGRSRT